MSHLTRFFILLGICASVTTSALAASYSLTPDTVYFTPSSGQTSVTGYVRIQHLGDTTGPGIHMHAGITAGTSYFSTSRDTVVIHSVRYWTITYTVQTTDVTGTITFSDDTNSRTIVLVGRAGQDAELSAIGPYFLTVPKNGSGCEHLLLINRGADADTITAMDWAHGPAPLFSYDTSITLPHVIPAHDTLFWTFCFQAPNDTLVHLDTIALHYSDGYSHTRTVSRVIYAKAIDTTHPDGELRGIGPYWSSQIAAGAISCQNLLLTNTGADTDTLVSIAWSPSSHGLFRYDSTIHLPLVLYSHDTILWSVCFHAPSDTLWHTDTLTLHYHDAYSQDRYIRRIVMAHASDTSMHDCYALFAQSAPFTEVGDSSRFRVYISNRLDSAVRLTAMHVSGAGDASFGIDSSDFPHTIAGHHYDSVWLYFAPHSSSASHYEATLTATFMTNDTSHCRTASVSLVGNAALSAHDTESVSLSDTTTRHVALTSDSSTMSYSHRVDIVNNIGARILVDTVFMTGSSHMYIAQNIRSPFPDTLANGATHSVIVHFYGDSTHTVYHDTLTVITEFALQPFFVYLDGYSSGTAGVSTLHASTNVGISVYPNPSNRFVTFVPHGLLRTEFEVVDILGNTAAQHTGDEAWKFDGLALPNGHYFVRVSGIDILGQPQTLTREIQISH